MITDENILRSLELIKEQLTALQDRRVVDIGRLRDLCFASRFAVRKANGGVKGRDLEIRKAILPATVPALAAVAYNEPRLINYKYCSDDKNRNELQKLLYLFLRHHTSSVSVDNAYSYKCYFTFLF